MSRNLRCEENLTVLLFLEFQTKICNDFAKFLTMEDCLMTEENTGNVIPLRESEDQGEVRNRIIISAAGDDLIVPYEDYGLDFDSSNEEILNALQPMIQETLNVNLRDDRGDWLYKTRKATESRNIHLIPNSTAG